MRHALYRRVTLGVLFGLLAGVALGPGTWVWLATLLPPEWWVPGGRIGVVALASLGVIPLGAAAGGAVAYVTRRRG